MKKFLKNFFVLSFSTIVIDLIDTFTSAYITKKLGTTFIGSFSLVNTIFKFLMTISLFGVPLAITKLVSEADSNNDSDGIKKITRIGCVICAIVSFFTCILTILFQEKIIELFLSHMKGTKIVVTLALSLPFIAISSVINGYFQALRKINVTALDEFLTQIVKSTILVLLVSIHYNSYLIFGISILVSEVISFIYNFVLYRIDINKIINKEKSRENNSYVKDILKISLPISFTSFVRSGLSTMKHALIPSRLQKHGFSRDYALSRYGLVHGIALPFVLIPWLVIECFASLILPEYSRYFAQKDIKKIESVTNTIFSLVLTLSIYISFVIYISSDKLCFLIYDNSEVSYYVKVLTPLIPIMYIDTVVDNMLRGLDLQVSVMKVNIIDVLISIVLIYFGVPILGTFGYILVIYVGEYLNGVLSIEILLNNIKLKFKYFEWIFCPLIVGFVSFFISNLLIKPKTLFNLIANLFTFSVLFFITISVYALFLKQKNKA